MILDLEQKGWNTGEISRFLTDKGYLSVRGKPLLSKHIWSMLKKNRKQIDRLEDLSKEIVILCDELQTCPSSLNIFSDHLQAVDHDNIHLTVFRSDFDYLPIDEQKSQSTTVKVLLLIAVNGLGVLVGTIGSQLRF